MSDDVKYCLGPPCPHFPDWVKTEEQARDYLAYKSLNGPATLHYLDIMMKRAKERSQ